MLWRGWGERKRERAEHDGKGKERGRVPAFSLFPSSHARFLFFDYCYFYRDTQRELLRRREGSSKERLRGPFLLGKFTSVKTSSAKRFKSLKFFAFSCKNDHHTYFDLIWAGQICSSISSKSSVTQLMKPPCQLG